MRSSPTTTNTSSAGSWVPDSTNLIALLTSYYAALRVYASFVLFFQVRANCQRTDAARYGSWPNSFFGWLGFFSNQPELAEEVYTLD